MLAVRTLMLGAVIGYLFRGSSVTAGASRSYTAKSIEPVFDGEP